MAEKHGVWQTRIVFCLDKKVLIESEKLAGVIVVLFGNVVAMLCLLVMHHPTGHKGNGQHNFDLTGHMYSFYSSRDDNVSNVTTAPRSRWYL